MIDGRGKIDGNGLSRSISRNETDEHGTGDGNYGAANCASVGLPRCGAANCESEVMTNCGASDCRSGSEVDELWNSRL